VMQREKVEDASNVMTSTFSIKKLVDVLFDSGTMYSFISIKLVEILGLALTFKPLYYMWPFLIGRL